MNTNALVVAAIAQFIGVTITGIATFFFLRASNKPWGWILALFGITYGLGTLGLITVYWDARGFDIDHYVHPTWLLIHYAATIFWGDINSVDWEWQAKLIEIVLFLDVIFLGLLVCLSGGTKSSTESVFTPIFIIIPALAVTFLGHMPNGIQHVIFLTILTQAVYVLLYIFAPPVQINEQWRSCYARGVVTILLLAMLQSVWPPLVLDRIGN